MTDNIEILREFNKWRRGIGDSSQFDLRTKAIGIAIDELIAEVETLRNRNHELENAAWLGQAHVLCNNMGVGPGHIENRLFEAIGKAMDLGLCKLEDVKF